MAIGVHKYYTEEMKADIDFNTGTLSEILDDTCEIDRHNHHNERWFELAGTPDGEAHVAVRIGDADGEGSFQIDAGNDTWGVWVQILGSSDTPADPQMDEFDFHKIQITASERTSTYYIQIAFGEDTTTALANNNYTEFPFTPAAVAGRPVPIEIESEHHVATTKAWARCQCPGQNTATLDFIIGIHEYPEEI